MTFIQPNKNSIAFRVFMMFIVAGLIGGTFWLIALYNQTVRLNQAIVAARTRLNSIGAENTTLNNQIITTLGNINQLTSIAASNGLVIAKPQYITVP